MLLAPSLSRLVYVVVQLDPCLLAGAPVISAQQLDELAKHSNANFIGFGMYYGILLAMLIYNLILFFTIKEKVYLYYVLYVFSYAAFQATDNGFTHYFFSEYLNPWILNRLDLVPTQIFIIALLLFTRAILQSQINSPRGELALKILMYSFEFCAKFMLQINKS